MPVTVQIPDTGAFQEVTIPVDFVSGMLAVGDFIYVIGGLSPGWITKIDKSNVSNYTILDFPADGNHISPVDLVYSTVTGHIYVLFHQVATNDVPDYQLTIGKVAVGASFAILSDFVNVHGVYLAQAGSITVDNTYLYAAIWKPSNLLRYRLSDANLTVTPLTGFTQASCIRLSDNKLFLTGWNSPADQWVARMSIAMAVEQSITFEMPGNEFLEGRFAITANHLWVGNRGTSGIVKRILKSNLSIVDISTNQLARGNAIDSDGLNIWALYENGRAARINPSNSEVSLYTVNEGQGFQREVTGDGIYVFTAT